MKLMLCERCMDLVVPDHRDGVGRACRGGHAVVWWDDGAAGRLAVCSTPARGGEPGVPGPAGEDIEMVSVIGLHNGLLRDDYPPYSTDRLGGPKRRYVTGEQLARILAETGPGYLFTQVNSLVIRCRPGYTSDTRYALMAEADKALQKAADLARAELEVVKGAGLPDSVKDVIAAAGGHVIKLGEPPCS